jgi:hypothetical protein
MRPTRIMIAATAAALPLLVTACSATATSPTASSAVSSPAATSAATSAATLASANPAGDPVAALTAAQIAAKANTDLKAATSFHVSGSITLSGSSTDLDITSGDGKCAGKMTIAGITLAFVEIGTTLWIDAGQPGGYLKTTTTKSQYGSMMSICGASQVATMVGPTVDLSKGTDAVIDGQPTLQLMEGDAASIYVTASATPEYVRYVASAHEQLDFSDINAPVAISPPPASDVLP